MKLPETKQSPTLTFANLKALVYGAPKVGKSTLAAGLDPDHTLFLACEPGLGGLEVYQQPIRNWDEFREAAQELSKGKHDFTTIVVDTIDELLKFCSDTVCEKLGIQHPSDLEYGKGWNAVTDEFRVKLGKLCSLGYGVVFVSHSKEEEIKQRVGTVTKHVPTMSGKPREWITGFVDFIFYVAVEQTEDGERRVIRTAPGESWEAGGRYTLPDPLPLDAAALAEAITLAAKPAQPDEQREAA